MLGLAPAKDVRSRRTRPITWVIAGLAVIACCGATLWWMGRLDGRLARHRGERASAAAQAERHAAALAGWKEDILAKIEHRLTEHDGAIVARFGNRLEANEELARWLDLRAQVRRLEGRLAALSRREYVPSAFEIRAFAADGSPLHGTLGKLRRVDPDEVELTISPGERGRLVADLHFLVTSPNHTAEARGRFLYLASRAWLFDSLELRLLPR